MKRDWPNARLSFTDDTSHPPTPGVSRSPLANATRVIASTAFLFCAVVDGFGDNTGWLPHSRVIAAEAVLPKGESASPRVQAPVDTRLKKTLESASSKIVAWNRVEDFDRDLAQFESVFWDPRDTESMRKLIRETKLVRGKTVLEIGTGTGLLALCCLKAGAKKVVATDVNREATLNLLFNAHLLGLTDRLQIRLVPLNDTRAYSVIHETERFDVILSNPPWEDQKPVMIGEFAFYDEHFDLMRSLLSGLRTHLANGGGAYLAYGHRAAVVQLQQLAKPYGLRTRILDKRKLESLAADFLPGMMVEVIPVPPMR